MADKKPGKLSYTTTAAFVLGPGKVASVGDVVKLSLAEAKALHQRGKIRAVPEGDPDVDVVPLDSLTLSELREIAAEYKLENAAGLKKADLVKELERHESEAAKMPN